MIVKSVYDLLPGSVMSEVFFVEKVQQMCLLSDFRGSKRNLNYWANHENLGNSNNMH